MSNETEQSIGIVNCLVDQFGNKIGSQIISQANSSDIDLFIVYGEIKAGKSTVVEGLIASSNNVVYLPYDYVYDNAQEAPLGLEKPFRTPKHHLIFSDYWLRQIKNLRKEIRSMGLSAKILTDVPKFRCSQALLSLGLKDNFKTRLLPIIGDPRNTKNPKTSRISDQTTSAFDVSHSIALNTLNRRFNSDGVVYKNVTGIKWDEMIRKDEDRIEEEVKRDWSGFNYDLMLLPRQFDELSPEQVLAVKYKILHMESEIDSMGFNTEMTPILLNPEMDETRDSKCSAA